MHKWHCKKLHPELRASSVIFKPLPKVKNQRSGENSPNLVTLHTLSNIPGANPTTFEFPVTTPAL
jgi:hypothetical protein